jgi:hypothetical protein
LIAAVAMATLAACGETIHADSAPLPSSNTLTSVGATTAPVTGLQPVPQLTVESEIAAVQLEVVHGTFLGIGTGSSLADALRTFGVSPILEDADHPIPLTTTARDVVKCLPESHTRWVINAGALAMIFEGRTADSARLTSWTYTGGPAIGFTRLVVSGGLTIDGSRQALLSRYPHAVDLGYAIDAGGQVGLQFGMHNGSISWFGSTDCGTT